MIMPFGHPFHDKDGQKYVKRGADNMRWVAEGAFSTFKRVFGERVMSPRVRERHPEDTRLKVSLYNKWRDESMARELERGVAHMT